MRCTIFDEVFKFGCDCAAGGAAGDALPLDEKGTLGFNACRGPKHTHSKTNVAPENKACQKEVHLPTIDFLGEFQGGYLSVDSLRKSLTLEISKNKSHTLPGQKVTLWQRRQLERVIWVRTSGRWTTIVCVFVFRDA